MAPSLGTVIATARPYITGSGTETVEFCPDPFSPTTSGLLSSEYVFTSPEELRWQADADVLKVVWPQVTGRARTDDKTEQEDCLEIGDESMWSPIGGLLRSVTRRVLPRDAVSMTVADILQLRAPPAAARTGAEESSPPSSIYFQHPVSSQEVGRRSPWLVSVQHEIRDLLLLEAGWDLYSARPIDERAVATAQVIVLEAARFGCPRPSIVPMSRGGIQVEWHTRGMNIEVTIPSHGSSVVVWSEDLRQQVEEEFELNEDLDPLRSVLMTLARRS